MVLRCVREAEKRIAGNFNMEYLPTNGSKDFIQQSLKLAFGGQFPARRRWQASPPFSRCLAPGSCRLMAEVPTAIHAGLQGVHHRADVE